MTAIVINETWTAFRGKLVFDFTMYRSDKHGVSTVKVYFKGNQEHRVHEISLPSDCPRHFSFQFNRSAEGEVYVKGMLRRESNHHGGGTVRIGVFADIVHGHQGQHDEQHFEGFMISVDAHDRPPKPDPIPDPIPDPDPDYPEPSPQPVIEPVHGDLFPYIYVRKWPTVSAAELRLRFICYVPPMASPAGNTLYEALLAARPAGREAMEDLALRYIEGDAGCEPPFLGLPGDLPAPLHRFADVALAAQQLCGQPQALRQRIHELLHTTTDEQIAELLASPACLEASAAAWQSYFALILILGYDYALLTTLIRFLGAVHLLNYLYTPALPAPVPPTTATLAALANASIMLPAAIFPLPAPAASPPATDGWIAPYAIGDLQMVRQRLLRYEAGELAYIENVMRGERKEVGRKRTHRQLDYQRQHSGSEALLENQAADERNSLLEEARRAVAEKTVGHKYTDFQTSYGPPTQATLNGAWDESVTQGKLPGTDDITRFAREVLNKTVNSITRQVGQVRGSSTLSENEETVLSVIDNSSRDSHMSAVFRWLNQVYEACVVNYGNRLMIEFMLPHPAAGFIADEQRLDGLDFRRPRPPDSLGLSSFRAITTDNYAELAAAYCVTELEPPPAPRKYASATLRGGGEKLLAVPDGYMVAQAYVQFITTPADAAAPPVLVGRELFSATEPAPASRHFGEDQMIAIAVGGGVQQLSPPSGDETLVNVEIVCLPMPTMYDAWRIKIYHAIINAYQRLCTQYYNHAGATPGERNAGRSPQMLRQIERRELKRACLRLLLQLAPGANQPGQPRYLQFFDDAFEWDEMSYRCYAGVDAARPASGAGLADGDELFSSFLQADSTRVLLPVHPPRMMALLYYLSSGQLWDGDNRLAPLNARDVGIVDEMKRAGMLARRHGVRVGQPWQVIVPTAMQVLDGCPLPRHGVSQPETLPPGSGEQAS
ncbi:MULTISPECIES: hypothetical protein [unclassified Janthinobacterium]|uniref:hypothetical protein n=1 Tax=unclassified Janthinobacterium TaxID=2610881 RepID=UPI001608F5AA|nr:MULTISPECIES: hypothetical protein [unclassified Janthinobacterium]MBB5606455.1 hypothetical protein [Janthinobacterium sp. S3T4]MBB5611673.1 hypothetical protein [Janthinobacterium sp. S3M3]